MDQKTWLWRKRSSEKTIVASDKAELTQKSNKEEVLPSEKELAFESSAKYLNDKSASVICECNAEDDLVADHAKTAQEAIAAREKAEADVVFLKQELNEALQQRTAVNERLVHLNAALRECMQQLSSVREEQELRICDAVTETSKDYEKEHKKLEEKLTEAIKRIANLTFESSRLSKALVVKDNLIEDLSKRSFRAEAEFSTLMARLDSTEKENAFLIYEFRMLEKELEIRNEEREYNLRSMDASHRQHLESAKKIAKLDAECQRLRTLVRKRLPGPAALAKMKTEVGIQGRNQIEMRRKRTPTTGDLLVQDFTAENQIPSKKVGFLIEQLCDMEQENRILQEIIAKRDDELCSLQTTFSLTASRLSQVEAQLRELSTFQNPMELATCKPVSNEHSLVSSLNTANNDEIVPSGSWASTLISGLDHFRHGETKKASESTMLGVPDMSLMDDFVEMEKLAIVSVDAPPRSSCLSTDASCMLSDSLTRESCNHQSVLTGKELVPVVQGGSNDTEREHQRSDLLSGKTCDWLQDVQKVIVEQSRVSKRSVYELLEDIRMALHYSIDPSSTHPEPSNLPPVGGYITWKSPTISPRDGSLTESSDTGNSKERTSNKQGIGSLQAELETLKESNRIVEEKIENQKLINEDLDTQLTMAKFRLNEVSQKLSSVEVELDDRIHCCEELEATCLELQLQLESVTDKEIPKDSVDKGKLLQNGSDMTAASAKLAECQETIFYLGKQLKALASPKEVAASDQVLSTASTFSTTTNSKNSSQRSSLRDQMLAEDDVQAGDLQSPKTKEVISSIETKHAAPPIVYLGVKSGCRSAATGVLAIVPNKKRGGGSSLLRKLLRRKKGSSKKTLLSFAT
ncbi:hypothetical protein RJ639_004290 [Escallonia herrerae]|uniref:Filament-like plant protein 7 n=1 Tax=Escallonia herrerae TaxID=1293975 RepID=A0AA88W1Y5_9ASTE|nr:hypothetical protein RJ639_004290 [Escallonia herrerae]